MFWRPRAAGELRLRMPLSVPGELGDDVELGRPFAVRLDPSLEGQPVLVDRAGAAASRSRRAAERLAFVAEHEPTVARRAPTYLPFFSSASLTSNRSAKSQPASIRTVRLDRLLVVVEDRQLLVEAVADRAAPDHRELRVDVDRPRAGHEEEAGLEVLEVVDRERVQPLAVDGQHPLRQEAGVEREQAGRDRSATPRCRRVVADDERVAVEDLDEAVAHRRRCPFVAGRGRRSRWRRPGEESLEQHQQLRVALDRRPRRAASRRRRSPRRWRCRSNSALSARSTQSAGPFPRETATSPFSTATSQRSIRLPSDELEAHGAVRPYSSSGVVPALSRALEELASHRSVLLSRLDGDPGRRWCVSPAPAQSTTAFARSSFVGSSARCTVAPGDLGRLALHRSAAQHLHDCRAPSDHRHRAFVVILERLRLLARDRRAIVSPACSPDCSATEPS